MSESKGDNGRVVFAAAIILATISVVMYFVVFLTLAVYKMLNDTGRAFSIVALVLSCVTSCMASYCSLMTIGLAIYGLIVLNDPAVKAVFEACAATAVRPNTEDR